MKKTLSKLMKQWFETESQKISCKSEGEKKLLNSVQEILENLILKLIRERGVVNYRIHGFESDEVILKISDILKTVRIEHSIKEHSEWHDMDNVHGFAFRTSRKDIFIHYLPIDTKITEKEGVNKLSWGETPKIPKSSCSGLDPNSLKKEMGRRKKESEEKRKKQELEYETYYKYKAKMWIAKKQDEFKKCLCKSLDRMNNKICVAYLTIKTEGRPSAPEKEKEKELLAWSKSLKKEGWNTSTERTKYDFKIYTDGGYFSEDVYLYINI